MRGASGPRRSPLFIGGRRSPRCPQPGAPSRPPRSGGCGEREPRRARPDGCSRRSGCRRARRVTRIVPVIASLWLLITIFNEMQLLFFFFPLGQFSRRPRLVPRNHRPACRRFLNDFLKFCFSFYFFGNESHEWSGGRPGSTCRRGRRLPPRGSAAPPARGSPGLNGPEIQPCRKAANVRQVWNSLGSLRRYPRICALGRGQGKKKK